MRKHLYIIAYDISKDKNRNQAARLLEEAGGRRINLSVFECMFSPAQLNKVWPEIEKLLDPKTDQAAAYPVCKTCYTKTRYLPEPDFPLDPLRVV
jgi:CRISPR-associated protein Cas2